MTAQVFVHLCRIQTYLEIDALSALLVFPLLVARFTYIDLEAVLEAALYWVKPSFEPPAVGCLRCKAMTLLLPITALVGDCRQKPSLAEQLHGKHVWDEDGRSTYLAEKA